MADFNNPDGVLRVDTQPVGTRMVLAPRGTITFENLDVLKNALEEATTGHGAQVVLDLRGVALMDSEALELLLDTHDKLEEQGGGLTLVHVGDVCRDILKATRLANVLHIYETLEHATGGVL